MNITILGKTPSKKNGKRVFVRNGKPVVTSSEFHNEWFRDASIQIASWRNKQTAVVRNNLPIKRQVEITITIFSPDSRKGDLTNKAESVMDLLVAAKILEDDNWECVPALTLVYGGVDQHYPRAEVAII